MKYRKLPVVIEAFRLTSNNTDQLAEWVESFGHEYINWFRFIDHGGDATLKHKTPEGLECYPSPGDYIVYEDGQFIPCKPDIFAKTYQRADESPDPSHTAEPLREALVEILGTVNFSSHNQMRDAIEGAMELLNSSPVNDTPVVNKEDVDIKLWDASVEYCNKHCKGGEHNYTQTHEAFIAGAGYASSVQGWVKPALRFAEWCSWNFIRVQGLQDTWKEHYGSEAREYKTSDLWELFKSGKTYEESTGPKF